MEGINEVERKWKQAVIAYFKYCCGRIAKIILKLGGLLAMM
jgi:hypothetical protein